MIRDEEEIISYLHQKHLNVFCVGKNYREHIGEVDTQMTNISAKGEPTVPIIFSKSSRSIIGHGECIMCPDPDQFDERVDYEGEVGLVMGKGGKVYGATIVNDVTARFRQKEHQQWFLGKSVDTSQSRFRYFLHLLLQTRAKGCAHRPD